MASLVSQSLLTYVEEGNVPALKALLEKCRDVDERNEVRWFFKRSISHCSILAIEWIISEIILLFNIQISVLFWSDCLLCMTWTLHVQSLTAPQASFIVFAFWSVLLSWKMHVLQLTWAYAHLGEKIGIQEVSLEFTRSTQKLWYTVGSL